MFNTAAHTKIHDEVYKKSITMSQNFEEKKHTHD